MIPADSSKSNQLNSGCAGLVNLSEKSFAQTLPATNTPTEVTTPEPQIEESRHNQDTSRAALSSTPADSMQEFYQLSQELLIGTLVLTALIFICVWIFYSLNIALNYLIGACTGVVYLRMLARDVERLGNAKKQLSKTRLALLIGLILLASQWNQLKIMPIFLGFLTYKAALIIYILRTSITTQTSFERAPKG